MDKFFVQIFNMSVSASYIVLAVLILRMALKKAPRWLTLLLWGTVGIRLVCPFTFESVLSLIPSLGQIHQRVVDVPVSPTFTKISYLNGLIQRVNDGAFDPPSGERMNLLQRLIPIFAVVWLVGILVLLTYSIVSYFKVRRYVLTAVRLKDQIYQSENVKAPFVLGFWKPKIYLPFRIGEKNMAHVVAHEQAHIRRLDHLWKPLGFVFLAIHWFNPLMWLSYILFCRDIEFACDEKVIKMLDKEARADYSEALLSCSVSEHRNTAYSLAFGEVGVRKRIKSVLNYRKPAFWVAVVAVVVCIAAMVCLCTEPISVYNTGIQEISVKKISNDELELRIKHSCCSGKYGVWLVTESEGEYVGDGMIDYDGALGKNRIMVYFGDDSPSRALAKQYPAMQMVEVKNSPIKILAKRVHPQDHGFVLYLGIDEAVEIEEVHGDLEEEKGTIKIPIRIVTTLEQ